MARKKKMYEVTITSQAVIQTTYRITATSPAAALAIARSGSIPPDDEETVSQDDIYYAVDGEEIEP